ncbi:hypothetical protein Scep_011437 [Stephania cephalantha]|uniref:Uncharacterized protein n=1 Tax=Stephania cephalantha TaxID=152367 RepID=A0AAP0JD92_9MAGN
MSVPSRHLHGYEVPPRHRNNNIRGYEVPPRLRNNNIRGYEVPPRLRNNYNIRGYEVPPRLRNNNIRGYEVPPRLRNNYNIRGYEVPPRLRSNYNIRGYEVPPRLQNNGLRRNEVPPRQCRSNFCRNEMSSRQQDFKIVPSSAVEISFDIYEDIISQPPTPRRRSFEWSKEAMLEYVEARNSQFSLVQDQETEFYTISSQDEYEEEDDIDHCLER